MAAIFEQSPVITLHPKPGFVVKTKIIEGRGHHLYQTKVFINICHDAQVPKPERNFDPGEIFPLIVRNEWEIPIIVSLEKRATDKRGAGSFVYDCCINSECFLWLTISADLRLIAIEWCIESVEMMHELVLERDYTLPKMLSKGELSRTEITQHDLNNSLRTKLQELQKNEPAGLVQELKFSDEEEEELPDLMNLAKKKPLIQEIKELSLDGTEKDKEKTTVAESVPLKINDRPKKCPDRMGEENISRISDEGRMQPVASKKCDVSFQPEKINYEFLVKQKTRANEFVLIFESLQLTLQVQIFFEDGCLTIRNNDSTRKLGPNDEVLFALLKQYLPRKCFLVRKEMLLYVFFDVHT